MTRHTRGWPKKRGPLAACLLAGVLANGLVGCSQGDRASPPAGWLEDGQPSSSQPLSYEQFREQARIFTDGEADGYIIESHIKVYSEESLRAHYHAVYEQPVKKSVGWLVNGQVGKRSNPTNISYCLAGGWGAAIGAFTSPSKASVVAQIAAGAQHWRDNTKVVFTYRSDLDGANCTTAKIADGTLPVSFVVKPTNSACTASGAFPWLTKSDQALLIPSCGLPDFLADHELGHILGLVHEMEHSQNDCGVAHNAAGADLTPYDRQSVMFYSNCTGDASSRPISSLDGVGIRQLYGPPDWWWSSPNPI